MSDAIPGSGSGPLPSVSGELRIGPYLLRRKLGEGGMGIVYLARDEALDRDVAIKVLRTQKPAPPRVAQRFMREAQAAARLNHPNVVTIHQFGESDGQLYLVMEHVSGGSLADELQARGRLGWREATAAIRDAALGLAAAHAAQVVHRDVKPSNLMRTGSGAVKVADFGLARVRDQNQEITQVGMLVGTPQFMSPEQCGIGAVDARSDLYSLVCAYYALLVGQPPFDGAEVTDVIEQHLRRPLPDPRAAVPEIPEAVHLVLQRGGRKVPAERFQGGEELVAALDAVLSGGPLPPPGRVVMGMLVPGAAPVASAGAASALPTTTDTNAGSSSNAGGVPNNLPEEVNSFIGRARELADALRLLEQTRLLTLTGPGGTGKTRLAFRIGEQFLAAGAEKCAHGVWFVDLAGLHDGSLLPQTVARVLSVREEPGRPMLQTLCDSLRPRRMLLIVDNCEHLIEPCARLAESLLRCAPGVRILATSREAIRISGEVSMPVPPLGLPDAAVVGSTSAGEDAHESAGQLLEYDAVKLFVDRAGAVSAAFRLDDAAAAQVARICLRLDGIPLAIELAAARVRMMSVEQIAQRLGDRFRLLTGGSRTAMPRQKTLRALIDWSYDLLGPEERLLLARLSIFAGGCTLDAAEAVGGGDGIEPSQVLDLLDNLSSKSLAVADGIGETPRYRLLESVRDYAREKLAATDEASTRDRHLAYFLQLAEASDTKLRGPESAQWMRRLGTEIDNLRTALDWAQQRPSDPDTGLRLASALTRFWTQRGDLVEGRQRMDQLLATGAGEVRTRAKALLCAGRLAIIQGDPAAAAVFGAQSLQVYQTLQDGPGITTCVALKGNVAFLSGDYAGAEALFAEVLDRLRQQQGDRSGLSEAAYNFALMAQYQGYHRRAYERFEQAMAYARQAGDRRNLAIVSLGFAFALLFGGDYERTIALCREVMATFKEFGDKLRVANTHFIWGGAMYFQGDLAGGVAHCERCLKALEGTGERWMRAMALFLQGQIVARQGDWDRGTQLCEQSRELARAGGDNRGVAWTTKALAWIAAYRGEMPRAAALFEESLRTSQRLPDWWNAAGCIEGLACLAAQGGQNERAAHFFGAAAALREQLGCPLPPTEKAQIEPLEARVRYAIGSIAPAAAPAPAPEALVARVLESVGASGRNTSS